MEQWIQTEVLAERLALGLDRNDAVVRNRLANKMTYVHRSIEVAPQPTDQQLRNLFESNSEDYRIETQLTLRQLYTGADESLARQLRESWLAGEDPRQLADQAFDSSRWSGLARTHPRAVGGIVQRFILGFCSYFGGRAQGTASNEAGMLCGLSHDARSVNSPLNKPKTDWPFGGEMSGSEPRRIKQPAISSRDTA